MPDPTGGGAAVSAAATIIATGVSLPILAAAPSVAPQVIIFGIALGLRADVLVAGFCGAVVAMAFFNTVPSTGDTALELFRTTWRRMGYALASAMTAGYLTPLFMLLDGEKLRIPESLMLSVAFVAGAGAQRYLAKFIKKESPLQAPGPAAQGNAGQGGGDAA